MKILSGTLCCVHLLIQLHQVVHISESSTIVTIELEFIISLLKDFHLRYIYRSRKQLADLQIKLLLSWIGTVCECSVSCKNKVTTTYNYSKYLSVIYELNFCVLLYLTRSKERPHVHCVQYLYEK